MKKSLFKIMLLSVILGFPGCSSPTDPSTWSSEETDKWFEKKEWLGGWQVTPDESINRKEFAVSYFKNRERWDKAFAFMKDSDLKSLELKRYDIDGDNLYAPVSEYWSKTEETAKFEAHKKYIDIQYVISGTEQMSVAPLSALGEVTVPYDEAKDVGFMTVTDARHFVATPEKVFIFFPSDIHRPGLRLGDSTLVRKIVVKVKVD
jgi:YhcH/YjgK/YiaL family protein